MRLLRSALDLFFPPLCLSCSKRLKGNETVLCLTCLAKLEWLEGVCSVCGNEIKNKHCRYCSSQHIYFDKVRSLFHFNSVVQSLIHNLKYNETTIVSNFLKSYFEIYLNSYDPFEKIDLISPVPLHAVRKRARGYNQAELLSGKIAKILDTEHIPQLIKRKKYTKSQTQLNKAERDNNVESAFILNNKFDISNKNILLVDDVFTTGSTVNSISKLLKENNCNKVFVLSIAHA
jgi:competence protein ComFC